MNELVKKENIKDLIYEIRGNQVMLDSDLARLYECKNGTKEVNQAVEGMYHNLNTLQSRSGN